MKIKQREKGRQRDREKQVKSEVKKIDLFRVPIFFALKINPKKIFDIFIKKSISKLRFYAGGFDSTHLLG